MAIEVLDGAQQTPKTLALFPEDRCGRLHREWYQRSALAELLGADDVIDEHVLYDCHDLLLEHKAALFDHLAGRWRDLSVG